MLHIRRAKNEHSKQSLGWPDATLQSPYKVRWPALQRQLWALWLHVLGMDGLGPIDYCCQLLEHCLARTVMWKLLQLVMQCSGKPPGCVDGATGLEAALKSQTLYYSCHVHLRSPFMCRKYPQNRGSLVVPAQHALLQPWLAAGCSAGVGN